MKKQDTLANFAHVKGRTFLVWTEAGFRKALRFSFEDLTTSRYEGNYPKRYPAVVTFGLDQYPFIETCRVDYIEDLERILRMNDSHRKAVTQSRQSNTSSKEPT